MSANTGQGNLLLEREAHVRALQHERQVIERGREHRVGEGGHDRGPLLTRANACARSLDLVAPLACEPNGVAEAQRRRQRRGRLGSRRTRRGRSPHREKENESKTRGTVHGVTACVRRYPPAPAVYRFPSVRKDVRAVTSTGGGGRDSDSERDHERPFFEQQPPPRLIAAKRIRRWGEESEPKNAASGLGVRGRSRAPAVLADKRDGPDCDGGAVAVGAHARGR